MGEIRKTMPFIFLIALTLLTPYSAQAGEWFYYSDQVHPPAMQGDLPEDGTMKNVDCGSLRIQIFYPRKSVRQHEKEGVFMKLLITNLGSEISTYQLLDLSIRGAVKSYPFEVSYLDPRSGKKRKGWEYLRSQRHGLQAGDSVEIKVNIQKAALRESELILAVKMDVDPAGKKETLDEQIRLFRGRYSL